jgi:hypothetical protein
VVALGLVVAWLAWPEEPEPPRARPYLEYTACLLTDGQGLAGSTAGSVWAGMQDASLATHAKVQYLAVPGEATVGNALPYLSGLVQRRCSVVFAVGAAQADAVRVDAPKYPKVRFVVLDGAARGANITALTGLSGDQLHARVRVLLTDVVHAASSPE